MENIISLTFTENSCAEQMQKSQRVNAHVDVTFYSLNEIGDKRYDRNRERGRESLDIQTIPSGYR